MSRFLRAHPPFDVLNPDDVDRAAAACELEELPAGTTIFHAGDGPVGHLRVVRSGCVEIIADGYVIDVLGEGEMFGHASMLSGFTAGFTARAAQQATCLRIGADAARELLSGPEGLRFVARSLLEEPTSLHLLAREPARNTADQPVGTLVRAGPVVCPPDTPISEAAKLMSASRGTSVVIDLGPKGWGIVTDRDMRNRVLAGGVGREEPVSAVMSAPAYTCDEDRPAGEVLLEMFDRGLRHFPVVSASGTIVGVVEEVDLVFARTRSSFYLRRRIADARTVSELADIAHELRPMATSLYDARVTAANVAAVYSVCVDALTRRLLDLVVARRSAGRPGFAWLALGSFARREALLSADIDSAIVWFDDDEVAGPGGEEREVEGRAPFVEIGAEVIAGLRECGMKIDDNGVSADSPPFVRSLGSWQRLANSWMTDPTQEKALILSSVLIDSRPVWGVHTGTPVADAFQMASQHPNLLRMLARFALSHRPPTSMFRGLVVEGSGEHKGRLDLKRALLPILDLARWGAISAGVTSASTTQRLRAAADAGTLQSDEAHTLLDAFELINNLRLELQVSQLRSGRAPDDFIDPHELSPLMRAHLRQALRAIVSIQRRVEAELHVGAL